MKNSEILLETENSVLRNIFVMYTHYVWSHALNRLKNYLIVAYSVYSVLSICIMGRHPIKKIHRCVIKSLG